MLNTNGSSKDKIYIREELATIDTDGCSLDSLVDQLVSYKTEYPSYVNLELSHDSERGYYDSYSCSTKLYGYRLETDEEFIKRKANLKIIDDRKKRVKQMEAAPAYQEYLKLKQKFGL